MGPPNLYHSALMLLLFTTLWFNSLARADYDRLCPAQTPQIQVDLTFYTITCDRSMTSGLRKVQDSASPEDCARVCTTDPHCHGMVWHSGNCWQSDNAGASSFNVLGAVLLVPGEKHQPDTGDPSTPNPDQNCQEEMNAVLQECNSEKQQCTAQKQECQTEKANLQTQISNLSMLCMKCLPAGLFGLLSLTCELAPTTISSNGRRWRKIPRSDRV
jgi:hypothetical protein